MRLFTAIPFDGSTREYLKSLQEALLCRQSSEWGTARVLREIPETKLHLTLQFLGEVTAARLAQVQQVILSFSAKPIDLYIGGLGCFQTSRRGGVIWAAVEPRDELLALEHELRLKLQQLGFDNLRSEYVPHITLARYSGIERSNEVEAQLNSLESSLPAPCRYRVEGLYLLESAPGAQYPIHGQCQLRENG